MFRSLHMKLVLIMLLLIVSLMTVVGAFLINGVIGFYINGFYDQMQETFADAEFVGDLRSEAQGEDAPERIGNIINAYSGALGINSGSRNYYILDGETGEFLAGSDPEGGAVLPMTPNILTALTGEEGSESNWTAEYMDVALPISGEDGETYIIYIKDNRQELETLNTELFMVILEALMVGLVISVLLSFLLSKSVIAPIERLTDGAKRVAAGDFSSKLETGSKDEIGVLTATFNDMAKVLEETLGEINNERSKLDTLFLHMTDGVVAFSRDGTVIHKNPAAEQMLGVHIGEDATYGSVIGDLYDFNKVMELKSDDTVELEHQVDGRYLEMSLVPFSGENAQGGVLAVIRDVTTQKKEENLRQEFVANVSHELRTPLTNVRSYAETLMDDRDLPADMRESFLGVILSETDRMTRIVQDLLTLSRFDSGAAQVTKVRFNPYQSLLSMLEAVRLEAQRHDHILLRNFENDLPDIVGDKARLEQVLMNVLSNAIKYTPDGGSIKLSAAREGDKLVISVLDNGIGIPKKDLPRIFERFYRVDKARSRESGGTGLGLSIAREIILEHDGDITIDSEAGKGTIVKIILPVAEDRA